MKKLALAALVVMIACPGVYAQDKPVTLGELHGVLDQLVKDGGGSRNLEELSIVIGPETSLSGLVGTLQLTENEEGTTTITGYYTSLSRVTLDEQCSNSKPKLEWLNDLGFYIIQFCDHSNPNVKKAYGDFHLLAGASASLGTWIGTQIFNCETSQDFLMMSEGARTSFC